MIHVYYNGYPENEPPASKLLAAKVIVALGDKDKAEIEIEGTEYDIWRDDDDEDGNTIIVFGKPLKTCDSFEEAIAWVDSQEKLRRMVDEN